MNNNERAFIEACGLNPNYFLKHDEKVVETTHTDPIVHISREEFNLLDATEEGTVYYIAEENGSITMMRGDNR